MNDEIKKAAEKAFWENIPVLTLGQARGFDQGFIAGANYANEKCQEEIKRLKEDLKWALSHWTNGGPLRQTDDKSKLKIKEIKQRHNLGASK